MKATLYFVFTLFAGAGCLLETGRKCGPHQDLTIENVCVCQPNAVVSDTAPGACVPCAANQSVVGGKCQCAEGFIAAAEGTCVPKPSGLGDPCNPAAPACGSPVFNTCVAAASGTGYCSKAGCAAPADCPTGFGCDTATTGGVCKRAPQGQGKACGGDLDCAGSEAVFCAPIINQCLVEGCSLTAPETCFPGYLCCDLTALGAAKTSCLPADKLPQGKCP